MLHSVILSGGSGTRFWPLSRRDWPKQFLRLGDEQTLLQAAAHRAVAVSDAERLWVITNDVQADTTLSQVDQLTSERLQVEPCGRNTTAAIGLAALHLVHADPGATMLVMPADHRIQPLDKFAEAVETAQRLVSKHPEKLCLFGVPPSYPATGFGYIQRGDVISDGNVFSVSSFKEKPSRDVAESYMRDGGYFWNCGIFLWRADRILVAIKRHQPELHASLSVIASAVDTPEYQSVLEQEFPRMNSISIDYSVLEHEVNVAVVEAPFLWDDVGSFEALARTSEADTAGNSTKGLCSLLDSKNCIVYSNDEHLVATVGLTDCVVVHTEDATLVARRQDEAALRRLIEQLEQEGHTVHL